MTAALERSSASQLKDLVERAIDRLIAAAVDDPRLDAELLMAFAAGVTRERLLADSVVIDDALRERYAALIDLRAARKPLAYIVGGREFYSLELEVSPEVLIPRPETETLVAAALSFIAGRPSAIAGRPSARILDLCTGSGAIALALAAELPDALVWATDSSADALAVAAANVAGCGATRVRLAEGSWFAALPQTLRGELALVVSNPPYIAGSEIESLPPEIAGYEPRDALVSGPTGLEAIEELVAAAPRWLAPGAALVVEIAPHQSEAALALAKAAGFDEVVVRDDLTHRPRVLVARIGIASSHA
jgi:release factor glutamine methyltransferase